MPSSSDSNSSAPTNTTSDAPLTPVSQVVKYYRSYLSTELGYSTNTLDAYTNDIVTLIKYLGVCTSGVVVAKGSPPLNNAGNPDNPNNTDNAGNADNADNPDNPDNADNAGNADTPPLIFDISTLAIVLPQLGVALDRSGIFELLNYMRTHAMGNRTIQRKLSGLSSFFDYLVYEGNLPANPLANTIKPKSIDKLPTFLTQGEIDTILGAIKTSEYFGCRDDAVVQTLYASGVRVSELVNIKITDINLERGFMRIVGGKGDKTRFAPLYSTLLDNLKTLVEMRTQFMASPKNRTPRDEGYIFVDKQGKQMTRQGCWYIVRKYARLAGISKPVSPHTLRHSFATNMILGGADLRTIQMFLGHSSLSTTQVYTHITDDLKRGTLEQFHPRQGRYNAYIARQGNDDDE